MNPIVITSRDEGQAHLGQSRLWEVSFWDTPAFVPWAPGKRVKRRVLMPVWLPDDGIYAPRRAKPDPRRVQT